MSNRTEEQPVTPTLSLTPEQLMEMIREMRKPSDKTPEQLAKEADDKQRRADQAQLVHIRNENRVREQNMCPHLRREDGSARTVYVQNGNFIICQECQKIMRPETDLQEFNRFFILSNATRTTF